MTSAPVGYKRAELTPRKSFQGKRIKTQLAPGPHWPAQQAGRPHCGILLSRNVMHVEQRNWEPYSMNGSGKTLPWKPGASGGGPYGHVGQAFFPSAFGQVPRDCRGPALAVCTATSRCRYVRRLLHGSRMLRILQMPMHSSGLGRRTWPGAVACCSCMQAHFGLHQVLLS